MFHHVKELQFNARVSAPDPRFARLLLEQFGGGNGELKAAMQYFVQSYAYKQTHPDQYDMLVDIAAEEFSHLEIVGATITMLLAGINGELKNAVEQSTLGPVMKGRGARDDMVQMALTSPAFLVHTGGGPSVTDCNGFFWTGAFVNANGDLTVDLRSNIGAESRAKIIYEYLMQFTDDPEVRDTLGFLMTREIAHFQMFSAALETIQPNFPPGVLQGDPRFTHTYFNMSDGRNARGPWNEGSGPWTEGEWFYVEEPQAHVRETEGLKQQETVGTTRTARDIQKLDQQMSRERSAEVKRAVKPGPLQWSTYTGEEELPPAVPRPRARKGAATRKR
jgi:Mn-containing catalase